MGGFMKLNKRIPSGREKDEASIVLLTQLREKLYSEQIGSARRAAFNLSWMQEDGLDILKEALFSRAYKRTKCAAAYGLRKMRGRMGKIALDVLSQGLKYPDKDTTAVCRNALLVLKGMAPKKSFNKKNNHTGNFEIRHIPDKKRRRRTIKDISKHRNNFHR